MSRKLKVLIIDDDYVVRSSLEDHLTDLGVSESITHAENGKRGLARIQEEKYDLVFLDIDLPLLSGMDVLRSAVHVKPELKYILMTAYGRIPDAVEALKLGAHTYLEKPLKPKALKGLMTEIFEAMDLMNSVCAISPLAFEEGREIVGSTSELSNVLKLIGKIAKVNTPVLIQGDSGTGKELVARALHVNSKRKSGPFATTNCSAIQESLFESEFFGHEKGSFTGAEAKKIGRFQYAEGGTLFLDEIGDLSLGNQVKLLRVLQEKRFTPVGSNLEIPYDVRIVAATHKNLEEMVEAGAFRQDLYFRLNVMNLRIPGLSERRADIPDLVKVFIDKFNQRHEKNILGWKPNFMEALLAYPFPGNIRELENAIERSFVLSESQWLEAENLPSQISGGVETEAVTQEEVVVSEGDMSPEIKIDSEALDFQKGKEEFEKKFIIEALKRSKGRLNQTALQANIPKKTLQRKIQKYEIDITKYKK
ncbi:MAG: sigma-54-dependent transcriptional regulator [Bdellovibrionales bacterium]